MAKEEKIDEVKQLISIGKEKGYLTYDELNNALPPEIVSSDQIDNIMMMFGDMDIEVIDAAHEERMFRRMGTETESYLVRDIVAQFRVSWAVEVGAVDYVYCVQSLPVTTPPARS